MSNTISGDNSSQQTRQTSGLDIVDASGLQTNLDNYPQVYGANAVLGYSQLLSSAVDSTGNVVLSGPAFVQQLDLNDLPETTQDQFRSFSLFPPYQFFQPAMDQKFVKNSNLGFVEDHENFPAINPPPLLNTLTCFQNFEEDEKIDGVTENTDIDESHPSKPVSSIKEEKKVAIKRTKTKKSVYIPRLPPIGMKPLLKKKKKSKTESFQPFAMMTRSGKTILKSGIFISPPPPKKKKDRPAGTAVDDLITGKKRKRHATQRKQRVIKDNLLEDIFDGDDERSESESESGKEVSKKPVKTNMNKKKISMKKTRSEDNDDYVPPKPAKKKRKLNSGHSVVKRRKAKKNSNTTPKLVNSSKPVKSSSSNSNADSENSQNVSSYYDEDVDCGILENWFLENLSKPYPSKPEKATLERESKMSTTQVSDWFSNRRKRVWLPSKRVLLKKFGNKKRMKEQTRLERHPFGKIVFEKMKKIKNKL